MNVVTLLSVVYKNKIETGGVRVAGESPPPPEPRGAERSREEQLRRLRLHSTVRALISTLHSARVSNILGSQISGSRGLD